MDMPAPSDTLPGRSKAVIVGGHHFVTGAPMEGPWPRHEIAVFALGCFWGAERIFWQQQGVHCTQVGYAGGTTPNPTYEEVCSEMTRHTEVVRVIFDPAQVRYTELLALFWAGHDPTQGFRQGNDRGSQYRSAIYASNDGQWALALNSKAVFQKALTSAGLGAITTEIAIEQTFFYAEDYHQQYLAKNPSGYCGIGGTGVVCPVGALE